MPPKILKGTRILELCHAVAGPTAGQILSDLGAEVIKVEKPDKGDIFRDLPGMGKSIFVSLNRGKKSILLDISKEKGKNLFFNLVGTCDVLITNLDREALKRLGIGWNDVRKRNPKIIMCEITGFGKGPYEKIPAYDPVIQASSGMMSVTGTPPSTYVRSGVSISDQSAALYCVISVLLSLIGRKESSKGSHLEVSLFDSDVFLMSYWIAFYDIFGKEPLPLGTTHLFSSPYNLFKLRDGYIYLAVNSQYQWVNFCKALGLSFLLDDPKFKSLEDRVRRKIELESVIQKKILKYKFNSIFKKLKDSGVPFGPLNTVSKLLEEPHLSNRKILLETEVEGKRVRVSQIPILINGHRVRSSQSIPGLGEHTYIVLRDILNIKSDELMKLRREGVLS